MGLLPLCRVTMETSRLGLLRRRWIFRVLNPSRLPHVSKHTSHTCTLSSTCHLEAGIYGWRMRHEVCLWMLYRLLFQTGIDYRWILLTLPPVVREQLVPGPSCKETQHCRPVHSDVTSNQHAAIRSSPPVTLPYRSSANTALHTSRGRKSTFIFTRFNRGCSK